MAIRRQEALKLCLNMQATHGDSTLTAQDGRVLYCIFFNW